MIRDPGGASIFRGQMGKEPGKEQKSSPLFTCIYNLEACFPPDPSHAGQISPAKTALF